MKHSSIEAIKNSLPLQEHKVMTTLTQLSRTELGNTTPAGFTHQVHLHCEGETYTGLAFPGTYRMLDNLKVKRRVKDGMKLSLTYVERGEYYNLIWSKCKVLG